jgi:hypothetical protein
MGMVICEKHGSQGIVPSLSIDVCKMIWSKARFVEIEKLYEVCVNIYDEDEFLLNIKSYVSDKQFCKLNLSQSYDIRNDAEEDRLDKILPDSSGVCGLCFIEFINEHGIVIVE